MSEDLLLVGSVPLETAEDVFRTFGGPLGSHLRAMPDGEIGDRRYWTMRLSYQVFNNHPDLDVLRRPARDDGVERLVPRGPDDTWQFKVRDGVDTVWFGSPGWRLGYARDALSSYFVFRTMKEKGIIPPGVRFQVSVPMTNSAISPRVFPNVADLPKVRPGYEKALRDEIATICEKIPQDDLAIQWDCSWEVTDVYGAVPGLPAEGAIERNVSSFRNLSPHVPERVQLGIHFCFGTFGGWPRFAPADLGRAVDLANAAVAVAGRRMDWIHIPTLDRTDDAFYAPVERLEPRGARVYLGMIHSMPSFDQRLAAARRHLPEFGIAAYCGFGRLPVAEVPQVLADHLEALRRYKAG